MTALSKSSFCPCGPVESFLVVKESIGGPLHCGDIDWVVMWPLFAMAGFTGRPRSPGIRKVSYVENSTEAAVWSMHLHPFTGLGSLCLFHWLPSLESKSETYQWKWYFWYLKSKSRIRTKVCSQNNHKSKAMSESHVKTCIDRISAWLSIQRVFSCLQLKIIIYCVIDQHQ